MTTIVEDTVKALMEFEAELDKINSAASDARKKLVKDASDWAESAKTSAVSKAQETAAGRISSARAEAEAEAVGIRKKGSDSLEKFEGSLSKHMAKSVELVVSRLMGEPT
jgi:vacuolar-type H+-ATPase subunit H